MSGQVSIKLSWSELHMPPVTELTEPSDAVIKTAFHGFSSLILDAQLSSMEMYDDRRPRDHSRNIGILLYFLTIESAEALKHSRQAC